MPAAPAERLCADCGEPLPPKARASRVYCQTSCRVRASRRRALIERIANAVPTLDGVPDEQLLAEPRLVRLIAQAGQTEWRAAAWLLERLHPERYGRRSGKVVPADADGAPDPFDEVDELAEARRKRVTSASD